MYKFTGYTFISLYSNQLNTAYLLYHNYIRTHTHTYIILTYVYEVKDQAPVQKELTHSRVNITSNGYYIGKEKKNFYPFITKLIKAKSVRRKLCPL